MSLDPKSIDRSKIDQSNMFEYIYKFPEQMNEAKEIGENISPEKENGDSFLALNIPFTTCRDSLNLLRGFSILNSKGVRFIASPVPSPTNALPFEI